jgi:hypothetical protein
MRSYLPLRNLALSRCAMSRTDARVAHDRPRHLAGQR